MFLYWTGWQKLIAQSLEFWSSLRNNQSKWVQFLFPQTTKPKIIIYSLFNGKLHDLFKNKVSCDFYLGKIRYIVLITIFVCLLPPQCWIFKNHKGKLNCHFCHRCLQFKEIFDGSSCIMKLIDRKSITNHTCSNNRYRKLSRRTWVRAGSYLNIICLMLILW